MPVEAASPGWLDAARDRARHCAAVTSQMARVRLEFSVLAIHAELIDIEDYDNIVERLSALGSVVAFTEEVDAGERREIRFRDVSLRLREISRQFDEIFTKPVRDAILLSLPSEWGPFRSLDGATYSTAHEVCGRNIEIASNAFEMAFNPMLWKFRTLGRERSEWFASIKSMMAIVDGSTLTAGVDKEWRLARGLPPEGAESLKQLSAGSSDEETFLPAELRTACSLRETAFNKYRDAAGVTKPRRGQRSFRYSLGDAEKIMRTIASKSSEARVRQRSRDWLSKNAPPRNNLA